jgi:AAA+ ATPase superfamily predicted ATPase
LVKKEILPKYGYIHKDISYVTGGETLNNSILTGIAMGDGRTHSTIKRARVYEDEGNRAIDELCQSGIIIRKKAKPNTRSWIEDETVSDKLYFNTPFLRFWFAFISPLFKGIKDGDYSEVEERFEKRADELVNLTFTQLSQEFLKLNFVDDPIVEIGNYWDKKVDIDILAKTASGKVIACTCKYTNSKIKKSELSKLQEKCNTAMLKPDIFVLFSKKGYSSELKSLKGENLRLFSIKSLKQLLN